MTPLTVDVCAVLNKSNTPINKEDSNLFTARVTNKKRRNSSSCASNSQFLRRIITSILPRPARGWQRLAAVEALHHGWESDLPLTRPMLPPHTHGWMGNKPYDH